MIIKTKKEVEKIRIAGKLASEVLDMITPFVVSGVNTLELNDICHDFMLTKQDSIPATLGYRGFPKSICTSVNQVICHGIPNEKKILRNGDILNIDVTVIKDGWFGDTSRMFFVGEPAPHAKRLVEITRECLYKGIEAVKPGAHIGDIGHAIQMHAEKNYYSVVREYCGHGIGASFHEEPQILHYGSKGAGAEIVEGMTFTIEPMLNAGKATTKLKSDGWTVETKDGRLSAQWEHTIAVTKNNCEILTL